MASSMGCIARRPRCLVETRLSSCVLSALLLGFILSLSARGTHADLAFPHQIFYECWKTTLHSLSKTCCQESGVRIREYSTFLDLVSRRAALGRATLRALTLLCPLFDTAGAQATRGLLSASSMVSIEVRRVRGQERAAKRRHAWPLYRRPDGRTTL
jgi:hypothetical protein